MLSRRRTVWIPAALFAGLAFLFILTVSAHPSWDAATADIAAWHIATTGNPNVDLSRFPGFSEAWNRDVWIVAHADGHEMIGRAPGVIAASIPAYVLVRPGSFTETPGAVTAALLTAAAMSWLFQVLRSLVSLRLALQATLVLALATPVWAVAADAMWPHTLTILGIVGMAAAARTDRWWLVGFWGGFACTGRLHVAVICVILAAGCAWRQRRAAPLLQAGAVGLAWLGVISLWTHWMYGKWDPTSGYVAGQFVDYAGEHRLDLVNLLGFFVSPHRGVFVWTPLVLVLIPALLRGWRELPAWTQWLGVGGLVYLVMQGLLNRFSGGFAFYGYRLPLEAIVCLAPAFTLSVRHCGRIARASIGPLIVVQVAMLAPGVVADLVTPPVDSWTTNQLLYWGTREPISVGTLVVVSGVLAAVCTGLSVRAFRDRPGQVAVPGVESGP